MLSKINKSLAYVVLKGVVVLLNQVDGGQNRVKVWQSVARGGIHGVDVSEAWQRLAGGDEPFCQTPHHHWLAYGQRHLHALIHLALCFSTTCLFMLLCLAGGWCVCVCVLVCVCVCV